MDASFWNQRRVFVTGHTGFKGGWLSLWLSRLGAEVTGYALPPPTTPSFFEATGLESRVTSVIGDIRHLDALNRAMEAARPEVVFHLAAQALVRRAHADPIETIGSNVMGTAHVLEAVRGLPGVGAVVVVTSDKVYDNREQSWGYREADPLGGREPYGASKAAAEMVVDAYRHSYFTDQPVGIATARAGNIIGGGDWAADRLVPDGVRAFTAGHALVLRNPAATRPWQYVLDPLRGYLLLAERLFADAPAAAGAWNFGPDTEGEIPVSHVAERMVALWAPSARWHHDGGAHPYEAGFLAIDSTKADRHLNWRCRVPLDDALAATMGWYRAHLGGGDMAAFSLSCIEEFSHGR